MIFLYIVCGLIVLMGLIALANWWRDERDKKLGIVTRLSMPLVPLSMTPQHPSIDPYLVQLREHLLTPPLPQGPGEMAERVYTHLNQWVNNRLTNDAAHTVDLEGDLLVGPRFVNASTNDPAPAGYLEDLMREET